MNSLKKTIMFAIVISINLCFASIILRNTFERYEGETWPLSEWSSQTGNNGVVRLWQESDSAYQPLAHGERSLHIYDPDNFSYASAYRAFSNSASEHMVEFYLWIPVDHQPIDSFPLCAFMNMPGEGFPLETDIALMLDSVDSEFQINVQDADSMYHNVAAIDNTDRWYKIQIYRHPAGNDTVVDFYLEGDLKGTYQPMSASHISNRIILGTTQADSLADGEVFYDDVIISTPPVGTHPRLLFDDADMDSLRSLRNDGYSGGLGMSYAEIWDSLSTVATRYCIHDTLRFSWPHNDTVIDTFSYYPYSQLPLHYADPVLDYWLSPVRQIAQRLKIITLVGLIDNNSTCYNEVKGILNSVANWTAFVDQTNKVGVRYSQLCTGEIAYGMALAYDWLYDSLSNYERMNISNTLVTIGIGQIYLQAIQFDYPVQGEPPLTYANGRAIMFGSGMGLSCLALDDSVALQNELIVAEAKIDTLLAHSDGFGLDGGFNEGISYGGYAAMFLLPFLIADGTVNGYLAENSFYANYPNWQIHCMLPGAEQYSVLGYTGFGPNWNVTFCDYDKNGCGWNPATCYVANYKNDECYQWFAAKRCQKRYYDYGFFLWPNPHLDSIPPYNSSETYSLTKVFSSVGWAMTRTGWQDNDYILALKSGPREPVSHHHHEQNSFIFGGKGRWLVADVGYARRSDQRERSYHNVLDDYEANPNALWQLDSMWWCYDTTGGNNITYFRSIDRSYDNLAPWRREIIFFNNLGSFGIYDNALHTHIDSLHWRVHSWIAPTVTENGHKIEINYSNGPKLMGYVVYPDSVSTSYASMPDSFKEYTTWWHLQRITVKPDTIMDTVRVVTGFAAYDAGESATVIPLSAVNFKGAKLTNEKGSAAVLFGLTDSTPGGKYEVSITDSLLNVVCNLVPDTNYLVVKKKGSDPEDIDTIATNNLGLLSFKLNGNGSWKVLITLARTMGSIQINENQSYCNMPYAVLKLESLDPFTGGSADSMIIKQYYTADTLDFTYSTGWIPFDSNYCWYLKQNQDTNIIFCQYRSDGWNESTEYNDTIIFDKTSPTPSFVINMNNQFTNTASVTLKNSVSDALSGAAKMRYGNQYLKNVVKNAVFDDTSYWQNDTAVYHGAEKLFEIPIQTDGNYFYQAIPPESLSQYNTDTMLLWVDLVSDSFIGTGKVEFQYVYASKGDTVITSGLSIPIPQGTEASVSHYNIDSCFKYHPEPSGDQVFIEARAGLFISTNVNNHGWLFIDNLRLDVVGPANGFTKFETYDSLKSWTLTSGNGAKKVYGQFSDGAGNETDVTFDTIIVDTTKPARKISSPQNGQTVSGTIEIKGWAYDYADPQQHFKQYELYYRKTGDLTLYGVYPDSIRTTPVNPTLPPRRLGYWNTDTVTARHGDGGYDLWLTVRDSVSNYRDTMVHVIVDNSKGGKGMIAGFSNYVYGASAGSEIYIGEFGTGKIYRYNENYQFIDTFKLVDSSGIGKPIAMINDESGKLWIANITSHTINRFSNQGNFEYRFGGNLSQPSGIVVDDGGNIWISDRLHHKIKKFSPTGELLLEFGSRGSALGKINEPLGIDVYEGKLYLADSKNKRISVFDTLGSFVTVLADSAGLSLPFGIVIDSTGCFSVSDFQGNQVIEFDPWGSPLYTIDSLLDSPSGLALSSDQERLYISDTKHKRLLEYVLRTDSAPPGGPQSSNSGNLFKPMLQVMPTLVSKNMMIRVQGMAGQKVSLRVYDPAGRLIKTLWDNIVATPNQAFMWDGKDSNNRTLSEGVYFIMLDAPELKQTRKIVLIK
jgi:streptogramin lyase